MDNWTYAVRGAFPGDEVQVKVERVFKAHRLNVCRVKRYHKKGDCHEPRTCSHKLPCPACPLHGVRESMAFQVKRDRIVQALRAEKLDFDVDPVVAHDNILGYRQKVKLMVSGEPGDLKLGVYVPYSHDFAEASRCPHVNSEINQAIPELMSVLNRFQVSGLQAIILRASQEGVAGILVSSQPVCKKVFEHSPLLSLTERIQTESTNSLLSGVPGQHVGPTQIKSLEDGQLVDPDSFCQTDPVQANRMYELVADYLWQGPGAYLDAYAGVGGFSKALLKKGDCQVTAVESNPVCKSALDTLPVSVFSGAMSQYFENSQKYFLGLVVDPPKKGLMHEGSKIAELAAKRVALVSCDPDAMVKDLKVFLAQGYQVDRIVPMDFFGATPAIETVVFMRKLSDT